MTWTGAKYGEVFIMLRFLKTSGFEFRAKGLRLKDAAHVGLEGE